MVPLVSFECARGLFETRVIFNFKVMKNTENSLANAISSWLLFPKKLYLESLTCIKSRHVLVAIVQSEVLFSGTKLDNNNKAGSRELKKKRFFERRTSTGSGSFAFLGCGFAQFFKQTVSSIRIKTLALCTSLVTSRQIKKWKTGCKASLKNVFA